MMAPRSFSRAPTPALEAAGRFLLIEMGVGIVAGEVVVRAGTETGLRPAGEWTTAPHSLSALRPGRVPLDFIGLSAVSCLTMGDPLAFRRGHVPVGARTPGQGAPPARAGPSIRFPLFKGGPRHPREDRSGYHPPAPGQASGKTAPARCFIHRFARIF
jgi:hypothetical protein